MGQSLNRRRKKRRPVGLIILAVLAAIALALGLVMWGLAQHIPHGDSGSSGSAAPVTTTTVGKTLPRSFIDRNTSSPYIILGDDTGKVLYKKNENTKCYPASLTKLITAIVAIEHTGEDTVFTVGDEVFMIDPYSSRAYLTVGSRLTLEQLIQALLLPSGNDAAYTLAASVGRILAGDENLDNRAAIDRFCQEMNKKVEALGCTGTHFVNPDGIHEDDHYTTAADMLKIAACALKTDMIARTVNKPMVNVTFLSGQSVTWNNSNRLVKEGNVYTYAGATGLKTGTTDEAGYCLAASAVRDGRTSIAIVMGSKTESGRWEDASGLLDISFQ